MRKHGGPPSRRDKHVTLAAISPPGVARGRFVGGQKSGLAGCKPPPLFTRGASSCSSQGRRQGEPRGASPRPSAPTYLPPVPNPGWKPLLLSTHQVFSYKGLVQVLDYIASLSNHTHPIVPILVDENIHKRRLRLLYSDRTQRWNWHKKLKKTPVLYGCWHPYKYLVFTCGAAFIRCLCTSALAT